MKEEDEVDEQLEAEALGFGGPEEPEDPDGPVDHDMLCMRCRYNLVGLPLSHVCPECGKPIRETVESSEILRICPVCAFASPAASPACARCSFPLGAPDERSVPEPEKGGVMYEFFHLLFTPLRWLRADSKPPREE